MSDRALATIRRISDVQPIEGADRIEVATVDGWQVVVKKGEFSVGDLGVYFEIDSFLPVDERYEFLRKSSYKKFSDGREGFRIKTIKLKKQVSQGLLLPLAEFPEINPLLSDNVDITKVLGVKLYEPPMPVHMGGDPKSTRPWFIPKTDQERIQNNLKYWEEYKDTNFEISEKVDGTSCTWFYKDGEFGICSRNLLYGEESDSIYAVVARDVEISEVLEQLCKDNGENLALQGEIIGPSIQGNPYKLDKPQFFLFDIYDIDNQKYLIAGERLKIVESLNNLLCLHHVPVIDIQSQIFSTISNIDGLLVFAEGKSLLNSDVEREGIVFKALEADDYGEILSFKVISNQYLLKSK